MVDDLADVFSLHAAGRTTMTAVERKLEKINKSVDKVLAGTVPVRFVLRF